MKDKIETLFKIYEDTKDLIKNNPTWSKDFDIIAQQFEAKHKQPDATIMMYGVFNAGKSSLINAMRGSNDAEVGPAPLTYKIDAYDWHKFVIYDTPGIDAPIQHEKIAQEQLIRSDLIIFVLNPIGVADERKTLKVLADLILQGKKIFVVFNPQDPDFDQGSFIKLKDQMRSILQSLVDPSFSKQVLNFKIFLIHVNRALKGRIENKPKLLEKSGILEFEEALETDLRENVIIDVYYRLSVILKNFLNKIIDAEQKQETSEVMQAYNHLLKNFIKNKQQFVEMLNNSIDGEGYNLQVTVKNKLLNNHQIAQSELEDLYKQSIRNVETLLKNQLNFVRDSLKLSLEKYNDSLKESINFNNIIAPSNGIQVQLEQNFNHSLNHSIDEDSSGGNTLNNIASLAQLALPIIFKIPILTPIVAGIQLLSNLFLGNDNEERARLRAEVEEAQAREQARQRFEKEVEDNSLRINNTFKNSLHNALVETIQNLENIQQTIEKDRSILMTKEESDKILINKLIANEQSIPKFK